MNIVKRIFWDYLSSFFVMDSFDYLWRVIYQKTYLPPWSLRKYVGSPTDFESNAMEFMLYFRLLCDLKPTESILDIGCGCGMMALALTNYLQPTASYTGFDISKKAIQWCQKNISSRFPNFHFFHADIYNEHYNPGGFYSS